MHLSYFMLWMLLSALAYLTPSTTSAEEGKIISSPIQTAKSGNLSSAQIQTKTRTLTEIKTILTAFAGPAELDCDHWYRDPKVRAWGGMPAIIDDAQSIIDLALSVRNGTTTETGLLGPGELATLERRYFGELDARRREFVTQNLRMVQKAWWQTTFVCRTPEVRMCHGTRTVAWVWGDEWLPVVNICPWWWYGSRTWRDVVTWERQSEYSWGIIREAGLIHEMLHLRIVSDAEPIVDLKNRMYCPQEYMDDDCTVYGPEMCQAAVHTGLDTTTNADSYSLYVMNIWLGSIFGLPPANGSQTGQWSEVTSNPMHHPKGTRK